MISAKTCGRNNSIASYPLTIDNIIIISLDKMEMYINFFFK